VHHLLVNRSARPGAAGATNVPPPRDRCLRCAPAGPARLAAEAVVRSAQRSLSPAFGDELDRLVPLDGTGPATQEELRIEYASLLGWTDGLVIAMLDQLERRDPSAISAAAPPGPPRQEQGSRPGPS
jgi:hypothetical protein